MSKVTLIKGDCLELLKDLPDGSIDFILTDPPYGTTACKWDTVIPFEPMWKELKRVIKPNGAIALFGSEPFSSALRMSNIKQFKYDWVWKKNAGSNFGSVKYQPMKEHELISVFANRRHFYFPIKQQRSLSGRAMIKQGIKSKASKGGDVYGGLNQGYDNSKNDPNLRYPSSVQEFKRQRGSHPTQKPVPLLEYLIKTYTLEGETVLDFTMGSGSTGVACKNLNRDFIGFELDEEYFSIAEKRINNTPDSPRQVLG